MSRYLLHLCLFFPPYVVKPWNDLTLPAWGQIIDTLHMALYRYEETSVYESFKTLNGWMCKPDNVNLDLMVLHGSLFNGILIAMGLNKQCLKKDHIKDIYKNNFLKVWNVIPRCQLYNNIFHVNLRLYEKRCYSKFASLWTCKFLLHTMNSIVRMDLACGSLIKPAWSPCNDPTKFYRKFRRKIIWNCVKSWLNKRGITEGTILASICVVYQILAY